MIYLVEDGNTYEMEQAEYSVTQLWSDIGGAGGNCYTLRISKSRCSTRYMTFSRTHFRSHARDIIRHTYWCRRLPLFVSLAFISPWFNRRKTKVSGSNLRIKTFLNSSITIMV